MIRQVNKYITNFVLFVTRPLSLFIHARNTVKAKENKGNTHFKIE